MLGGLESLHDSDIDHSNKFIQNHLISGQHALDVGGGVGRISMHVLLNHFSTVSILESNKKFLDTAIATIPSQKLLQTFNCRFQEFQCSNTNYDLIWIQWVLMFGTDAEVVEFLKLCKSNLSSNGKIVLKENIIGNICVDKQKSKRRKTKSSVSSVIYDEEDCSVMRSMDRWREIFLDAKLEVVEESEQASFGEDVCPVVMFLLK